MDIQGILYQISVSIPGFLLAITAHEWAHARVAYGFGDNTAESQGRMSLNPAVHIDMFGTIMLPIICIALGGMIFGYAKPVPVNLRNFKDMRKGMFWVSFAGPLSNLLLGVLSAFTLALVATQFDSSYVYFQAAVDVLKYSVSINFILAIFNLIPFPPLDGSKMVASFLKGRALLKYESLAQYANMVFIGIFALSMLGISTIGHLLSPALSFGNALTLYFLRLLG